MAMNEDEEFEFRHRAEQEAANAGRRSPIAMSKEYTGTFLPFRIDPEGKRHLAVPGVVQSALQAITAPGRSLESGGGGDWYSGKESPGPEEAVNVALNAIPALANRGIKLPSMVGAAKQRLAGQASRESTFNESIARGRTEGLVLYPENMVGQTALLLGGKSKMRAAIKEHNMPQYDRMAREEAGLAPDMPINRKTLKDARTQIAQPYRDLEKLSPKAGQLWREVQDLRVESRKAWDSAQTNAERDAARKIDSQIEAKEQQIDKIGQINFEQPKLAELRSARKRLAKNYMIDEANVEGTGHIDEEVIRRALQNGRYLEGKLETIGRFKNAERYVKNEMAQETDALHMAMGGGAHHVGGGGWYPGIPILGKQARRLALSEIGQSRPPSYKPGLSVKLGDIGFKATPYGFSVVPSMGLRRDEEE